MNENPKFLHLANHRHENLFKAPIMIGGFYNWHLAMNGEFSLFKMKEGKLQEADILFIGMSKPELEGKVASRMRKEIGWKSKTKIVVCIDYAIELWQGVFNPYDLENELMQSDMIFVSEPAMKDHVEAVVNGRKKVHHIVHPSNIEAISKLTQPKELRTDEIAAIIHRYDSNWLDPFLTTKNLEWDTIAVLLNSQIKNQLWAYFKFMVDGFEFTKYLQWVSRKKIILDSYHKIHTYGRSSVDAACLSIPCVGSDFVYSQKYLWPEITTKAGYVFEQQKLIQKLMTNEKFYDSCVDYAKEKLVKYTYTERKKELLDKLYN